MAYSPLGTRFAAPSSTYIGIFGDAAALSSNGSVLAVGEPGFDGNKGRVLIYDVVAGVPTLRVAVQSPSPQSGEFFGSGVALSGDGTILAVGGPMHDNSTLGINNNGAVYVYDWSGSAFVMRGSRLHTPSPLSNDNFGYEVCLSSDGTILAVWCRRYGAMLYDWSGIAWVYRTEILPYPGYIFGGGIAISGDGAILAVGAPNHETVSGSEESNGAVYIYDVAGSTLTQRGGVLKLADENSNTQYGISVAVDTTGNRLAIGYMHWVGSGSFQGAVDVLIWDTDLVDWVPGDTRLQPSDIADQMRFGSGIAISRDGGTMAIGAPGTTITNTQDGVVYLYSAPVSSGIYRVECPAALTINNPSYRVACPSRLSVVGAPARIDCPARLSVVAITAGIQQPPRWTARCLIDGVDVSASLIDTLRVQGAEGGARIASVQIQPASGTVLPLAWVGKPIILDYVPVFGGVGVPQRLFTGRIDTPEYDFATGTLSLRCTDDLQNRVAALDLDAINTLVGGRYTAAVQGEIDDRWDYAQARLTTVAGSLDASPAGALRTTPWESSTVWATFTQAMLIDGSTRVRYPQRSTMINQVQVEFDYRYARLRERRASMGWSGTNLDMAPTGWQYPSQQDVVAAANGTGWTVLSGVFYPAPAAIPHTSGGFIYPAQNSIDMAILHLGQRHSQTVTEAYRCTVSAPESVAQNGVLPGSVRGALESAFDGQAWESAFDVAPLMPGGGEQDYAPDATRSDADYALQTLLDQARVKILGSHRSTRITASTVCLPALDMDKRVAIDTLVAGDEINAEGKVVEVEHVLDLRAGTAITTFSLACFGAGGAGIITPDALDVPDAPDPAAATQDWPSAVPSLFVSTPVSNAYSENLMGLLLNTPETIYVEDIPSIGSQSFPNPSYSATLYPVEGFRVRMPGVVDADRNPITLPAGRDYALIVPADPLIITKA